MKNKNVSKELGRKISFGPYLLVLSLDCQISYYKDGTLVRAKDVGKEYDERSLYDHALQLATRYGYKESDLKCEL